VEVDLSDWLSEETAHVDQRRKAEELFEKYEGLTVTVKKGKFTKLCGSEADIVNIEEDLKRTFVYVGTNVSHAGGDSVGASVLRAGGDARGTSVSYADSDDLGTSMSHDGKEDDREGGKDQPRDEPRDPRDRFTDYLDVDKHTWHYLLFKHANLLSDFSGRYSCGLGLKPSRDSDGNKQSKLQLNATSKACLQSAADELVSLLQVLMESDIQQRQVDLIGKECRGAVEEELKRKDLLLFASTQCTVVGPAAALMNAQSIISAAVSKNISAGKSSPDFDIKKDSFSFQFPVVGLTVHVRQGTAYYSHQEIIFICKFIVCISISHSSMLCCYWLVDSSG